MKHKRIAEDALFNADLSLKNQVTILFSKPKATAKDSRNSSQQCLAVVSNTYPEPTFLGSTPVMQQSLGPVPLARVSDLIGWDEDSKLSPSARTEQTLDPQVSWF